MRSKSIQEKGVRFVRENGRPYSPIRASGNPDWHVSDYEIFRGDLAQIIFDNTQRNDSIEYIFNEQIHKMRQMKIGGGSILVDFANRSVSSEYDLVVACEGAASRT